MLIMLASETKQHACVPTSVTCCEVAAIWPLVEILSKTIASTCLSDNKTIYLNEKIYDWFELKKDHDRYLTKEEKEHLLTPQAIATFGGDQFNYFESCVFGFLMPFEIKKQGQLKAKCVLQTNEKVESRAHLQRYCFDRTTDMV